MITNKLAAINERLHSYQFQISQKIFGERISLNLTRKQAAKITGLSIEQYTRIEQGIDLTSSKNKYLTVLTKLS